MMMLEKTIEAYEEMARKEDETSAFGVTTYAAEYSQIAEWLKDYKRMRESARKKIKHSGENLTGDCISRNAVRNLIMTRTYNLENQIQKGLMLDALKNLPSVQPEPLTDKEQRIFLAAMGREEKICKEVDAKFFTREPYEDSLMSVCREIERKVKGALWT